MIIVEFCLFQEIEDKLRELKTAIENKDVKLDWQDGMVKCEFAMQENPYLTYDQIVKRLRLFETKKNSYYKKWSDYDIWTFV